jgi:hypothetical protein
VQFPVRFGAGKIIRGRSFTAVKGEPTWPHSQRGRWTPSGDASGGGLVRGLGWELGLGKGRLGEWRALLVAQTQARRSKAG